MFDGAVTSIDWRWSGVTSIIEIFCFGGQFFDGKCIRFGSGKQAKMCCLHFRSSLIVHEYLICVFLSGTSSFYFVGLLSG